MPRRKPTRPGNEVSQTYNDGILTVYAVTDDAAPGYQPTERLSEKGRLRYEEQRLGLNRLYLARQAQVEISRVVRTMRRPEVSPQDLAITEDGTQYRIDTVQVVKDVWPPSMDLSLVRITENYEVKDGALD